MCPLHAVELLQPTPEEVQLSAATMPAVGSGPALGRHCWAVVAAPSCSLSTGRENNQRNGAYIWVRGPRAGSRSVCRPSLEKAGRAARECGILPDTTVGYVKSPPSWLPASRSKFASSSPDRRDRVSEAPRWFLCQRRGAAQLLTPNAAARDALAVRAAWLQDCPQRAQDASTGRRASGHQDKGGEIAVASLTAQTQARRLGATSTPLTHRYWCFSSPSIPSSFIDNIHSLALSDPAFAQCEPTAALCTLPPPHAGCARRTTRATLHCSCRGLRPNA
ncbi:hypothetical protein PSPO01_01746 [Paraphaeosphaeria sporulosa]